jgi:filamentous hemagglutinin
VSEHGLNRVKTHAPEFLQKGIPEAELADFIMEAILNGRITDYQGKGSGRPIYELTWKGKQQKVAITVGNNGFVVGANPK